ncbi:MAG: sulfatase-like hydrolase/transferase [Candidatus Eisenbacteria bacterium]
MLAIAAALLALLAAVLRLANRGSEGHPLRASELEGRGWNVVLISLDTVRPDVLRATGGDAAPVPSPGLDRLLGDGVRFTEMVTPAPVTTPAHASLLTALNPYRHGVRENTESALPQRFETLPELYRRAGYRTAAFVSSFVLDRRFGLSQGFDRYDDRLSGPEPGLGAGTVELPGAVTIARAARWLEEGRGASAPFFLFVHLYDAHAPYRPPQPFAAQYPAAPYNGELAYLDQCVGQLLDAIEASGAGANTLVWLVSDHGESLGEHGEASHSLFIYDATLRVASLLRLPPKDGHYRAGKPRLEIARQCGLIDVAPTLCAIGGLAPLAGPLDGHSLLPLLRGEQDGEPPLYCETLSPRVSYHWAPLRGVRTSRWKYVRAPQPELYDLAKDPKEKSNLASSNGPELSRLAAELDRFLSDDSGGNDAKRTPSAEELERLRSLGYLSGTGAVEEESTLPDPKRMVAFFNGQYQSAKNLLYAGRYAEAATAFQEALQVDPLNNSTYLFLAAALRQSNQLDAAGRAYRGALKLEPASPRAWYGWGQALLEAEKADSAAWAFHAAIALLPRAPEQWSALGEAEWNRGRPLDAFAAFDSALTLGGDDPRTRGLLARLYLEANQPTQAQPLLKAYGFALGTTPEEAAKRLPIPRGRPTGR